MKISICAFMMRVITNIYVYLPIFEKPVSILLKMCARDDI